jgi:hypothetical protein
MNCERGKELTAGLTETQFNWRPAPEQWSIEECLAHLTVVGQVEVQAVEKAVDEAKAKRITGTGPFEYPVWERFILRETEPPVRHQIRAPERFVPAQGGQGFRIGCDILQHLDDAAAGGEDRVHGQEVMGVIDEHRLEGGDGVQRRTPLVAGSPSPRLRPA